MKTVDGTGLMVERSGVGGAPWAGVVVVSATEPARHEGTLWLDTSETGATGKRSFVTVTANTTLNLTHDFVLVDASAGAVTITLPTAATEIGHQYDIKKIDPSGHAVTIDANGSETIDGGLTSIITAQYNSVTVASNGTEWWIP